MLTPYEKNLEFWRQLWRVVERSDVVVQIVDARNPLLFRCEDLEQYVKEVSEDKMNLILINKADFLTETQRKYWADYFSRINVRVVFFSAVLAAEEGKVDNDEEKDKSLTGNDENKNSTDENDENVNDVSKEVLDTKGQNEISENTNLEEIKDKIRKLEDAVDKTAERLSEITKNMEKVIDNFEHSEPVSESKISNSNELLTREKLIQFFETVYEGPKTTPGITTIGLVGYPNVGKSSTINALLSAKKVSVSATPGKTKHFQTLYLTKDVLLCDCPGLVMPSFVFTKAEMIVNGILPIDQMRDHVPPVNLVATLIPRHVIEDTYGIMLPAPMEGEDPDRCPFAEEVLNAYGCKLNT